MPANSLASDKITDFQLGFILNRGIPLLFGMLRNGSFLSSADIPTRRYAQLPKALFVKSTSFPFSLGYHFIKYDYLVVSLLIDF